MIDASVLVVGAGAIGGVAAAKMAGGVRRVAVLDANAEHVARMREPGLDLDVLGEERRVKLEAHADPADLDGPFDFALVTLKAPHLEEALAPLVEAHGQKLGDFKVDDCPAIVETVLQTFQSLRNDDETLTACVNRVGIKPFREAVDS